jgi:hypothetical protein
MTESLRYNDTRRGITVTGTLACDASSCVSGRDRAATLLLTIDAGPGLPFEVRHVVGVTPEAHINAERLAQGMRRGAAITASAESLHQRGDHGIAAFVLRLPTAIRVGEWELVG